MLRGSRLILNYDSFARWRDTRAGTGCNKTRGLRTRVADACFGTRASFWIFSSWFRLAKATILRSYGIHVNPVGTTWISWPEFRLRDTRREIRYGESRSTVNCPREGEALMNLTRLTSISMYTCKMMRRWVANKKMTTQWRNKSVMHEALGWVRNDKTITRISRMIQFYLFADCNKEPSDDSHEQSSLFRLRNAMRNNASLERGCS